MHMADALLSPAVGAAAWAGAAGLLYHSARRLEAWPDERRVPLMGVAAAFVFAAQMVNFTIPATGSSGHLGGGLLLAILLGPHAAFLAMASVLTVQALLFADGGLLALGCNILNLGFFPCFVAYPLLYRPLAGGERGTRGRVVCGSLLAALLGLQLGALGVVLATTLSGISELPFAGFLLLMLPIHGAIGLVEGLATAAVVLFLRRARPEVLEGSLAGPLPERSSFVRALLALLAMAVLTGGALSWFASTRPDGLEWAVQRTTGEEELPPRPGGLHRVLATVQRWTALLPGYDLRPAEEGAALPPGPASSPGAPGARVPSAAPASTASAAPVPPPGPAPAAEPTWPAPKAGTTLAGLAGSALTLALAAAAGLLLRRRRSAPGGSPRSVDG